jgi:23S rRNA (cytosine1962-C5)-methyltransferase
MALETVARVAGRVRLRRNRQRRAESGHHWIYEGEIDAVLGSPGAGDVVDVLSARGQFIGRGFFNPHSKIRARVLTHRDELLDRAFFARRIQSAVALRRRVVADATAYRVVFGDGDRLSGLIVDRYGDLLVLQSLSAGIDARQAELVEVLIEHTGATAAYERNDGRTRGLEGLSMRRGRVYGAAPTQVEIREGRARFLVDVERGQKTGWFCDQRENRLAAGSLAGGAEVLDVFCHTGGFGIHALAGGATSVLGIDGSGDAVAAARANAALNGFEGRAEYREADAFDELRRLYAQGRQFDMVILDPPAFARSKEAVGQALAGYKDINLSALGLVRPDGFLVSCSCTWHVDESMLWSAILEAARDARRELRLIEFRSQARDHPMLASMPETRYLKCFIIQVL